MATAIEASGLLLWDFYNYCCKESLLFHVLEILTQLHSKLEADECGNSPPKQL